MLAVKPQSVCVDWYVSGHRDFARLYEHWRGAEHV